MLHSAPIWYTPGLPVTVSSYEGVGALLQDFNLQFCSALARGIVQDHIQRMGVKVSLSCCCACEGSFSYAYRPSGTHPSLGNYSYHIRRRPPAAGTFLHW